MFVSTGWVSVLIQTLRGYRKCLYQRGVRVNTDTEGGIESVCINGVGVRIKRVKF